MWPALDMYSRIPLFLRASIATELLSIMLECFSNLWSDDLLQLASLPMLVTFISFPVKCTLFFSCSSVLDASIYDEPAAKQNLSCAGDFE